MSIRKSEIQLPNQVIGIITQLHEYDEFGDVQFKKPVEFECWNTDKVGFKK